MVPKAINPPDLSISEEVKQTSKEETTNSEVTNLRRKLGDIKPAIMRCLPSADEDLEVKHQFNPAPYHLMLLLPYDYDMKKVVST